MEQYGFQNRIVWRIRRKEFEKADRARSDRGGETDLQSSISG
jgi:hypothetical protein